MTQRPSPIAYLRTVRHEPLDRHGHRRIDKDVARQPPLPIAGFAIQQMPTAGLVPHDLSTACALKSLLRSAVRLYFWHCLRPFLPRQLFGSHHHDQAPAFHARCILDGSHRCQLRNHVAHDRSSHLLIRHLTPPEGQDDLRLVAIGQKSLDLPNFDLQVVLVRPRP